MKQITSNIIKHNDLNFIHYYYFVHSVFSNGNRFALYNVHFQQLFGQKFEFNVT